MIGVIDMRISPVTMTKIATVEQASLVADTKYYKVYAVRWPVLPGVNAEALLSFLTFGYVAGTQAAFDGMQRLTPGTALVVDARAGTMRTEAFWQWPEAADRDLMSEGEAIERLRAELTEAVRIRMRSDVPLGAFLSGGMDSAAVLALMARHSA